MKRLLVSLSLIIYHLSLAFAIDAFQGILPVTDPQMKMSLNGTWQLKVVEGITGDQSVPAADATWGRIPVPGCWEAYGFCKPSYDKALPLTGYYRTSFTLPAAWKGQRIVVRFDGVLYGYDLWINGKPAGSWRSAYNTALFDITPYINSKRERQELAISRQRLRLQRRLGTLRHLPRRHADGRARNSSR